jgi:hypothetical protein
MGWRCQPHTQPSIWRTRVLLFVWVITFEWSGKWYHISTLNTASTVLRSYDHASPTTTSK